MMVTTGEAMVSSAATATGAFLLSRSAQASQAERGGAGWDKSYSGGAVTLRPNRRQAGRDYTPTVTPGGGTLPLTVVAGVKIFHL
jgi:hypothetical protein